MSFSGSDPRIQRHDILIHKIEIYIIYRIDICFVILVLDTSIQLELISLFLDPRIKSEGDRERRLRIKSEHDM